jgi:predicted nucleic acid-binding protein
MLDARDITFDERVSRLAQYRPFDHDGAGLHNALQGLIYSAAAIEGGEFKSFADCREALRVLWDLDFDIEEIKNVADALEEEDLCKRTRAGFVLSQAVLEDLEKTAEDARANEAQAFEDWETLVRSLGAPLGPEDFSNLRKDLDQWLGRIVSRHGVEAALLLYPEDERAWRLIAEIEDLGLHFLPQRSGALGEVREEALRGFIRSPSQAQRVYLANRLNAAFELTVLTLDPGAAHLVKQQFTGHRVYLDTNFLYALLGYSPAEESLAAHRLVALTKELGFELAVTPWTVDELRTSLRSSQHHLEGMRLPSQKYADLMIKAASEKGFDRAFWVAYRDSNISTQDFFDRAAHFEHDLEKLGIEVTKEGCERVDKKSELIQKYVVLLDHIRGPQWRETVVLEHDAKHRILIEQLRGDGHHEFSNGRYWFLTQDTRLPFFARSMPEAGETAPNLSFCMLSSAWAQIMRAFTPRTSDWEKMVVDLLASPYVGWSRGLDSSSVAAVVGRIDQYEGDGVEFAWQVLADTAKMTQVSALKADGATSEEVAEYIDGAFIEKATEAQERAGEAEAHAQDAAKQALEAQEAGRAERERAEQLQADRDHERRRREETESDLERERCLRNEDKGLLSTRIEEISQDAAISQNAERKKRETVERELTVARQNHRRIIRLGISGCLVLVACIAAAILLATHSVHGGAQKGFVIVGASLIALVGLNIGFSEKWMSRIFDYLGVILGITAIVISLLSSGSR